MQKKNYYYSILINFIRNEEDSSIITYLSSSINYLIAIDPVNKGIDGNTKKIIKIKNENNDDLLPFLNILLLMRMKIVQKMLSVGLLKDIRMIIINIKYRLKRKIFLLIMEIYECEYFLHISYSYVQVDNEDDLIIKLMLNIKLNT